MVDLTKRDTGRDGKMTTQVRLLDLVPGRSGPAYAGWLTGRGTTFTGGVQIATLDPFHGCAKAIRDYSDEAVAVLDGLHVVELALAAKRRPLRRQQNQLGHRGRKDDLPLPNPQRPSRWRRRPQRPGGGSHRLGLPSGRLRPRSHHSLALLPAVAVGLPNSTPV